MNKMQSNKGFTLIEMLVSTAIGAIIVAALFILLCFSVLMSYSGR